MKNSPFRILIATDLHLGYGEKDPIRSGDSINTLEEILQIAKYEDVDFVLLGGDLFHENKPSRKIMCQTISLLRKYCIGVKKKTFEIINLCENDENKKKLHQFNINDENLKISIPIFSIHGNHDDPIGVEGLCSLDVLSNAGLVNFFGKNQTIGKITLRPLLFKKADTQVAVYGLGALHDQRLHNMFKNGEITAESPSSTSSEIFSIFVLHQNRHPHSEESHIPEKFIFDFFDLVYWGHEHECLIDPVQVCEKGFFITQPGSTIITSLSKSESVPKHVGILSIDGKSFKIDKIPLKTVRPLLFKSINLDQESPNCYESNELLSIIHRHVDKMLSDYLINSGDSMLPLLRLKVRHLNDVLYFNGKLFGKEYIGKIANTKNMILFKKINTETSNHGNNQNNDHFCLKDDVKIEDFVSEYIEKGEDALKLKIFPLKQLCEHVSNFTTKDDRDSISFFVDSYFSDLLNTIPLTTENMIDENIQESIDIFRSKDYIPTPKTSTNITIDKENVLQTISATKTIKKTTRRRGK